MPKTSLKTNIILFIITLIVMFLFTEIALRFVLAPPSYPVKQVQDSDNDILNYALKPDIDVIDKGPLIRLEPVRVKTNSEGLREDEEHSIEKPEGTTRIAFVGDSVTFGMYVEQSEAFPHLIETMLNNELDGTYETLNFGVPGYNTHQEMEQIKIKVLDYNPDIVVLTFVLKDFKADQPSPLGGTLRNIARHCYTARLTNWIVLKYTQSRKKPPKPSEAEYAFVDENLIEINRMLKERNITLIMTTPAFYRSIPRNLHYSAHFENLSTELDFTHLNLVEVFDEEEISKVRIEKEGHPTPYGHQILALNIYNSLIDHIDNGKE